MIDNLRSEWKQYKRCCKLNSIKNSKHIRNIHQSKLAELVETISKPIENPKYEILKKLQYCWNKILFQP